MEIIDDATKHIPASMYYLPRGVVPRVFPIPSTREQLLSRVSPKAMSQALHASALEKRRLEAQRLADTHEESHGTVRTRGDDDGPRFRAGRSIMRTR